MHKNCPYCETDLKWKLISLKAQFSFVSNSIHLCPQCKKEIVYNDHKIHLQLILSILFVLLLTVIGKYLFGLQGATFQIITSLLLFFAIIFPVAKYEKTKVWSKPNSIKKSN